MASYLTVGDPLRVEGRWEGTWWDSALQHMVLLKNSVFYFWSPRGGKSGTTNAIFDAHAHKLIGDQLLLCKLSLDLQLLAVQRSATTVTVFDLVSNQHWNIEIRSAHDNRLMAGGILWSEHGGGSQDLILVTTRGLEMWKVSAQRGQCKMSRTVNQGYSFHAAFWYEPNFRCIIMASPIKSTTSSSRLLRSIITGAKEKLNSGAALATLGGLALNGYFFKTTKESLPKLELPAPDKTTCLEITAGTAEGDVSLFTLYGKLFCGVHVTGDRNLASSMQLYHVNKSTLSIIHTHTLSLSSICRAVTTSVVDNLLIVHCHDLRGSMVFDVLSAPDPAAGELVVRISSACPAAPIMIDGNWATLSESFVETPATGLTDGAGAAGEAPSDTTSFLPNLNSNAQDIKRIEATAEAALKARLAAASSHEEMLSAFAGFQLRTLGEVYSDDVQLPSLDNADIDGNAGGSSKASSDEQRGEQSSEKVVSETYRFLSPCWVWEERKRLLWHLVPSLADLVMRMHDPRSSLGLLMRRGQTFQAPRAVHFHAHEQQDSLLAKRLILHVFGTIIERRRNLSFVQAAVTVIAKSYARLVAYAPAMAAKSSVLNNSATSVKARGSKTSATAPNEGAAALSPASSNVSSPLAPSNSASSDALSSLYALSSSVTNFVESTQATLVAYAERLLSPSRTADEDTALESVHSAQQLMADINSVGSKRHRDLFGLQVLSQADSQYGDSSGTTTGTSSVGNVTAGHAESISVFSVILDRAAVVGTHRDPTGHLVVTQTELLSYVWLPQILIKRASVDFAYLASALTLTQSTLQGAGVETTSAASLCLLKMLEANSRYVEIGRLLQLQFFPDDYSVATFALDLGEKLDTALSQPLSALAVDPAADIDASLSHLALAAGQERVPGATLQSSLSLSYLAGLRSAVRILHQTGLDMLWRIGEKPLVVRWLLTHGRITDAMRLCCRHKGQWRAGLPQGCVDGVDFYDGAVVALRAPSSDESCCLVGAGAAGHVSFSPDTQHTAWQAKPTGYAQRVGLLFSVYQFVKEWQVEALKPDRRQPQLSQLAAQSREGFPRNVFSAKDEEHFKSLFGFTDSKLEK